MKILDALINASTDAIFIASAETGMIVFGNESATKMTGYSFEELCKVHHSQLHPAEDADYISEKFTECMCDNSFKEIEARLQKKDGTIIPIKITKANLFEENGKVYAAAYFKDMSLDKNMEEIAFIQSHIVRAPLANILGLSQFISEEDDIETIKDFVKKLKEQAHKLDTVIADIVKKSGH